MAKGTGKTRMTMAEAAAEQGTPAYPSSSSPACYSPAEVNKRAVRIAVSHRSLMDAMTQQGPSEVAGALDHLEAELQQCREALGL